MDFTQIKDENERYQWVLGRLTGLAGTARYNLDEEIRNELKEIIFVLENL